LAKFRKFGIAFELEEESENIGVADKKKMKMIMNMLKYLKKSINACIKSVKVGNGKERKEVKSIGTTHVHCSLDVTIYKQWTVVSRIGGSTNLFYFFGTIVPNFSKKC